MLSHIPQASSHREFTASGRRKGSPTMTPLFAALSITLTAISEILIAQAALLDRQVIVPAPVVSVWEGYANLKRMCSCESWGTPENEPRQFKEDGAILWGISPK